MPKREDLSGKIFGYWRVIEDSYDITQSKWKARCVCGTERFVKASHLRSGASISCGCVGNRLKAKAATKHGGYKTPEYSVWAQMKARCNDPNSPNFKNYGARGIAVCPQWNESFEAFLADMGPRPSSAHSLDRVDNDGNYEPGNCRWTTWDVQCGNKRPRRLLTAQGRSMTPTQWAAFLGVTVKTIYNRLEHLSEEEALTMKKGERHA